MSWRHRYGWNVASRLTIGVAMGMGIGAVANVSFRWLALAWLLAVVGGFLLKETSRGLYRKD